MGTGGVSSKSKTPIVYGTYHFVSWLKGFNNLVAYSLKYETGLLLCAESNICVI